MPYARVNGNMLFYRESGEGPAAIFIHGFPLDHSLWLEQLKGLAHVRRCIALDLRGFGRSDPMIDPVLTMEMLADDVAEFARSVGVDHFDVVGLSMGGYVALALYELRPRMVRSLALLNTKATADGPEARAKRDEMVARLLDDGKESLAAELMRGLLSRSPTSLAQARLRSMVEGTRYETLVAAIEGMKERKDRSGILPRISVPSLVIGGEDDILMPADVVKDLAAGIPGARTTIVPGAGHLTPLESPEAVNHALIELFEGRKVVWWK